jgi:hypothetical protein
MRTPDNDIGSKSHSRVSVPDFGGSTTQILGNGAGVQFLCAKA